MRSTSPAGLQRGGLVQRIGHGHQLMAFVVTVIGALARAILIALDLGQGVPPQVLRLIGRIDDGMLQAIVAVQVLGQVAQCIGFGQQVVFIVIACLGGAVRVADLGHQRGQVMEVAAHNGSNLILVHIFKDITATQHY